MNREQPREFTLDIDASAIVVEAAKTIKRHWDGVLRWFDSKINNVLLEGTNSIIQAAKCRARGFRSVDNFVAMAYLIAVNLHSGLST